MLSLIRIPMLARRRNRSLVGHLTTSRVRSRSDGIVVVGPGAIGEIRAVDLRDRGCQREPGVAQAEQQVEPAILERTSPQGPQPGDLGVRRGVRAREEGLQVELAQTLSLPAALPRPERHRPRAPELVATARAPLDDSTLALRGNEPRIAARALTVAPVGLPVSLQALDPARNQARLARR